MDVYWIWLQFLAYVTGAVEKSIMDKCEYVLAENKMYKSRQKKRIIFTDVERIILAEKAKALGRDLKEAATIVKPDTLLKWYRELIAMGDRCRSHVGDRCRSHGISLWVIGAVHMEYLCCKQYTYNKIT